MLLSTLDLTPKETFSLKRRRGNVAASSMVLKDNSQLSVTSSSGSSAPASPVVPSLTPPSHTPGGLSPSSSVIEEGNRSTTVYTSVPVGAQQPDFGAEAMSLPKPAANAPLHVEESSLLMSRTNAALDKSLVASAFIDYEASKRAPPSPATPVADWHPSASQPLPTSSSNASLSLSSGGMDATQAPRKPTYIVHWPEEMAGADYQKLMAIEPGTSVQHLLEKMLNAPVAKARGPWNSADWALWIERCGFLDEGRTTTFYELVAKDELYLLRKGSKRPENKRAVPKVESTGSDLNLPKPLERLLVRTKSERHPSAREEKDITISSPLTTKTAQSFGVSYEPQQQPNRLPDDLARAKAEHDRLKEQRKTMGAVTPPGSGIGMDKDRDILSYPPGRQGVSVLFVFFFFMILLIIMIIISHIFL